MYQTMTLPRIHNVTIKRQEQDPGKITMQGHIRRFLLSKSLSKESLIAYDRDLSDFQKFTKGDLSDDMLLLYKAHLKEAYTPRSQARKMSTVRSFLDYLVSAKVLPLNYYAAIKGPKIDRYDSPYVQLTDDEVNAMLEHTATALSIAIASKNPEEILLRSCQNIALVLSFHLGLRVSELAFIRYNHIIDGTLHVKGKGSKKRTIPVPYEIHSMINSHLMNLRAHEDDFLLTTRESNGAPAQRQTIGRWFKAISRACGITKKACPHSARATAITKALDEGAGIRDVANFAGHSSVETTSIYDKKRGKASARTVGLIKYGGNK